MSGIYGAPTANSNLLNSNNNFGSAGKTDAQLMSSIDDSMQQAFLRKTFTLLFFCLVATVGICALFYSKSAVAWVNDNWWIILVASILFVVFMIALFIAHKKHPANLICLGGVVVCMSIMLGTFTAYYNISEILTAAGITLSLVLFITIVVWVVKSPAIILAAIIGVFVCNMIIWWCVMFWWISYDVMASMYTILGATIFSLYLLIDLWLAKNVFGPDEVVIAVAKMYIDIIYIFMYILAAVGGGGN
ncbi:Bax inhibitor 1-related like protein [Aduncisulcus paluster]|uniref:Bax inhibitor 1-related like protein n=1 Tax=Aduncisulcus paluster TaxID=2918883 RepID=A0ABQ5K6N2_9EUKA|nr:Bax inhibitor 1-related like protein [Aduncisulcus paluster]|eukprot:gnl/Carplike_NY0171/862_a1186_2408.p1 GENE.gnl/Carplike_NY0171/862_a1186_2408~~gnl/Carplike_NY0171/862_a1186_2408.p1  ORF type:complete len:247 (-),score=22.98 gnl/Carplike_NY0171/862_a1186_2408:78-818(-)